MPIPQAHYVLKGLAMGQRRFLHGIDCTPDDRLNWSPGEADKTPLAVAGRLGGFLTFAAHMLRHREIPNREGAPEPPPATRAEARSAIESAFSAARQAVENLEEEHLKVSVPAPWGETTLEEMLWWLNGLVLYHQGQLNYIQLCYGDKDPNIPKGWGAY